jgi:hypothetical protein
MYDCTKKTGLTALETNPTSRSKVNRGINSQKQTPKLDKQAGNNKAKHNLQQKRIANCKLPKDRITT